jgi:excisionase family DNA binding protein
MTGDARSSWPVWLPRRLLTVDDIAEILRVDARTVRRWIADGRLPRAHLGGRVVRVRPEAVLDLVEGQPPTKTVNNSRNTGRG